MRSLLEIAGDDAANFLSDAAEYLDIGDGECSEGCEYRYHCDGLELCGHPICEQNGCLLWRARALRHALKKVATP